MSLRKCLPMKKYDNTTMMYPSSSGMVSSSGSLFSRMLQQQKELQVIMSTAFR